jgi:hypothetical protein
LRGKYFWKFARFALRRRFEVNLGLSYYFWLYIALTTNLPTNEWFSQRIAIYKVDSWKFLNVGFHSIKLEKLIESVNLHKFCFKFGMCITKIVTIKETLVLVI